MYNLPNPNMEETPLHTIFGSEDRRTPSTFNLRLSALKSDETPTIYDLRLQKEGRRSNGKWEGIFFTNAKGYFSKMSVFFDFPDQKSEK